MEHNAESDASSALGDMAWVIDYDMDAPVDKSLFPDPSIGNCPGCSNVMWHAKRCPWLAQRRNRARIAAALKGHRLDTMNQDSGQHCICGSDSRFEQRDGDHPWTSMDEHRADMVTRVLPPEKGNDA